MNRMKICETPSVEEKRFLDFLISTVGKEFDGVFLLRAGTGESYFFSHIVESICCHLGLKNPCIVSTKERYGELYRLMRVKMPFFKISFDAPKVYDILNSSCYFYNSKFFYVNPSPVRELKALTDSYARGDEGPTYVKWLMECNGIATSPLPRKKQTFNAQFEEKVLNQHMGDSNPPPYALIIKKANFFQNLSEDVLKIILDKLQEAGIKPFLNDESINLIDTYVIASRAAVILGARCGLLEVLSTLMVPMHIFFTPLRHFKTNNPIKLFSIKELPGAYEPTLYEYDMQKSGKEQFLKVIFSK